jgi:hypothetical protein
VSIFSALGSEPTNGSIGTGGQWDLVDRYVFVLVVTPTDAMRRETLALLKRDVTAEAPTTLFSETRAANDVKKATVTKVVFHAYNKWKIEWVVN